MPWHATKHGQTAEKTSTVEKNFTVEKISTVGRTSVRTYTRAEYLPRRYRGEHIRSVRLREGSRRTRYQGGRWAARYCTTREISPGPPPPLGAKRGANRSRWLAG